MSAAQIDFYAQKQSARRRTTILLLGLTGIALLALVSVAVAVTCALVTTGQLVPPFTQDDLRGLLDTIVWSCAGYLIVCALVGFWRSANLAGPRLLVERLGGIDLQKTELDDSGKRLLNVVEEVALAAGEKMPGCYLLRDEQTINILVAGHGPQDAVLGVTRGALERLSRDELQALIAQAFGKACSGELLLRVRLGTWAEGVLLLPRIFSGAAFWMGNAASEDTLVSRIKLTAFLACGLLAWLVAGTTVIALAGGLLITVTLGLLLKDSVANQGNRLADAAAVEMMRQSAPLASGLHKVLRQGDFAPTSSELLAAPHLSPLFLYDIAPGTFWGDFGARKELEERIEALEKGALGRLDRQGHTAGKIVWEPVATEIHGENLIAPMLEAYANAGWFGRGTSLFFLFFILVVFVWGLPLLVSAVKTNRNSATQSTAHVMTETRDEKVAGRVVSKRAAMAAELERLKEEAKAAEKKRRQQLVDTLEAPLIERDEAMAFLSRLAQSGYADVNTPGGPERLGEQLDQILQQQDHPALRTALLLLQTKLIPESAPVLKAAEAKEALAAIQKTCLDGVAIACRLGGELSLQPQGPAQRLPKHLGEARLLFWYGGKFGDGKAATMLGYLEATGQSYQANGPLELPEAALHFRRAAELGDEHGQRNLESILPLFTEEDNQRASRRPPKNDW